MMIGWVPHFPSFLFRCALLVLNGHPHAVARREIVQACKRKRGAGSRVLAGSVLLMMSGWYDDAMAEMDEVYT